MPAVHSEFDPALGIDGLTDAFIAAAMLGAEVLARPPRVTLSTPPTPISAFTPRSVPPGATVQPLASPTLRAPHPGR